MLVETEFRKLEKFHAAYFRGTNYFDGDGAQNYLVFQPEYKYFEKYSVTGSGDYVTLWKSKGLSNEKVTVDKITAIARPKLKYYNARIDVKLEESLLRQNNATYNHWPIVNIYITYKISSTDNSNIVLENCLFGALKISNTTALDTGKYEYSGYGICFDSSGSCTHPDGVMGNFLWSKYDWFKTCFK